MNFLFLHNNFPGQFHHVSMELAKNPEHKVMFLSCFRRKYVQVPGVEWRLVAPKDSGKTLTEGATQPPVQMMSEIFADAMIKLKKEGFKPDVVYSHAGFGPGLYAPDIFLDASHAAYLEWMYTEGADVAFNGGRKNQGVNSMMQQRYRNMCALSALETIDAGICPTYWQREQHPPHYYDKIHVLHDGVDTNFFSPDPTDIFRLDGVDLTGKEIVTFATRGLEPYRGFPTFYRSLPAVLAARPKAHVIIMADDRTVYGGKPKNGTSWKEVLREEVPLDESRVHFIPFQPYEKYRSLLRSSHVHVYLTVPFVLSWSMLESMSCGCLVVGSDTEPVREVIHHEYNGLLTQIHDHDMLARRIVEGLEKQKDFTVLREKARETVLTRYALSALLPQHVHILENLGIAKNTTLHRSRIVKKSTARPPAAALAVPDSTVVSTPVAVSASAPVQTLPKVDNKKINKGRIMKKVIWYSHEAYTTKTSNLLGRRAAGESFIRGYLTHCEDNDFTFFVNHSNALNSLKEHVKLWGYNKPYTTINKATHTKLAQNDLFFYPMPGIGQHALQRSFYGDNAWSICGITHTTCSQSVMDCLTALLTTPVQPWDALICTSKAVKTSVSAVIDAHSDFLKKRLRAKQFTLPQLPVIPLGINTSDFSWTDDQKKTARQTLGVDDDTIVVLYVGRLSFHGKVHPFPMYRALEMAAVATGKKTVLVECGWHTNSAVKNAFAEAHKAICPSVRVVTLDGRHPDQRLTAWAGADVFCSLSDNIQETYGLAPVEAMAAGLPVVASDWDGYRDTVRNGVDGFLVRSLTPEPGPAEEIGRAYAWDSLSYGRYIGYASMVTAIDVEETAKCFVQLMQSKALRESMGQAGRKRAREVYDWKTVLVQYEELWENQNKLRKAASKGKSLWAARMDPFRTFACYPTEQLAPTVALSLVDGSAAEAWDRCVAYRKLGIFNFAESMLPTSEELRAIIGQIASGQQTSKVLLQKVESNNKDRLMRGVLWLCKAGILQWNREAPRTAKHVKVPQIF